MTPRMFAEYKEVTDLLTGTFGKAKAVHSLTPDDFAKLRAIMAQKWGPVRLVNTITCVKGVFKYGLDNGPDKDKPLLIGYPATAANSRSRTSRCCGGTAPSKASE